LDVLDHKPTVSAQAAQRGEPSYVWRDGQKRRLKLIQQAAGERVNGTILENGCGVGAYLKRLAPAARFSVGLEVEFERAQEAAALSAAEQAAVVNSVGESLPFESGVFDLILSHEVLEHVADDRRCLAEIARCLKPGGRLMLFCPNRWYPFETHGVYLNGKYHFGNKFAVNYLPRSWRNRLAPHVNVYTGKDLERLLQGLPVRVVSRTVLFGAYDNIIARSKWLGLALRECLQFLEKTPLKGLGLSHFWVIEKTADQPLDQAKER